jgi:hypothetical protein
VASSRRGGTRAISIGVDLKSIGRVIRELDMINLKTRTKIIKNGLRDWGRKVAKQVKRNVTWKATNTPRAAIQKVKTYPKGASYKRLKRIWLGVGIKEGARSPGKEVVGRYGDYFPGWRAHFYEAGWSPWPKGRPTVRTWGLGLTRKERRALKRQIDENPSAFIDSTPRRQGNYQGQPASRMRAILAFARRKNQWRKGLRRINGTRRVYTTRFLGRAGAKFKSALAFYLARSAREAIQEVARG